jgi:hypothetical protein
MWITATVREVAGSSDRDREGILVAVWAKNLLTETGNVLLDRESDSPVVSPSQTATGVLLHPAPKNPKAFTRCDPLTSS